ncbi:TniB family NTP-binding protein [Microbulbifer sp. SSSA007]|uniref:TniB family NTP-binding protein n=1 Tax=Microbulbifer sp. SSSA007 TaxID=3243379 RepID=UPI0040390329
MKRVNAIRPFIKSPFITEMLKLFDTLRLKKQQFDVASCLLLTGESGSGKSALAEYYVDKNPIVEQDERTYIPVLHFELKAISTPLEFLRSLLVAIGDPQQGMGARNQGELYERLITLIRVVGVELLILDEIQVIIERRSAKVVTGIADIFKDLIKDTKVPIVFMGMPWSKYLVDSNRQLKGRIAYRHIVPPFRISQKTERDNYRRLLKLLSDAYGISSGIKLEDIANAYRVFAATDGNLRATANLIGDAYILSKMEGKPFDLNLLASVLREYGVTNNVNPFILPLDKLELRELIIHSDWHFGYRANKNSIVDAEYAIYGIAPNKRLYMIEGAA